MNLAELRDELSFILNFNDGQADQDFTNARLDKLLQRAYTRITHRASQEGQSSWWKTFANHTWEADAVTFALPTGVSQKGLRSIVDYTDGEPGVTVFISKDGDLSQIFWKDYRTLQWGDSGPSDDRSLRFYYLAEAEELTEGNEPKLIPPEYHELIVWEAACIGRQVADETAPPAWIAERDKLYMDYIKLVSRGRPHSDVPWFEPLGSDLSEVHVW